MKDKLTESFLELTEKYGLDPYLLGALIVLVALIFKVKFLLEQKEEGKINAYEYPPLILGIIVFIALLIFAF